MTKIFKSVCLMVALALVLSLGVVLLPAGQAQAQSLFEHWNDSDVTDTTAYGTYSALLEGQTFTAIATHSVTSVRLKLYQTGTGTVGTLDV